MGKLLNKSRYSIILIFLELLRSPIAHSMEVIEFLTVGASAPSIQNDLDSSLKVQAGFSVGAGLALTFRLVDRWDLESSIVYLPRNFSESSNSGLQTSYNLTIFQYSALARYWLSEKFALGIGPYYSAGIGNLTLTQNSQTKTASYSDSSLTNWELGVATSAQYRQTFTENMIFVAQTRLLLGLSNLENTQNVSLYTRDLQLWCGIGFKL
jgi:hypothetical protein